VSAARLISALSVAALVAAGCGGGSKTVTEAKTESQTGTVAASPTTATATKAAPAGQAQPTPRPQGNHGPRYFETPSHNIGCYVSAHDARCDIRERSWSPPPEPKSCIKTGLDFGQGLVVGQHRAEFVCAGDTSLGGEATLGYGQSAQRGSLICVSKQAGIACRNTSIDHGFFLSRERYRIF
jgi:hypothetical protein